MMFNNGTMNGAYNYQGMVQPMQKFNNVLNQEEILKLQQKSQEFSLAITEEEMLRGVCNHRNADGTGDALVFDPITGEARCTICGYKFRPVDADSTIDNIKDSVANVIDILQTIKLMYMDLPANAAKEYFPIIPLLEKIPQLFEFAAKNMTKHEAYNWQYNNGNMSGVAMFNNLQNMFASGMGFNPAMGYGMPQQPMMGQPVQPNPALQGGYGMPQQPMMGQPGVNPFGYNGASMQPQYAPASQGFAFVPNQATTPAQPTVDAAPTAPAPTADTTVTQTVNA